MPAHTSTRRTSAKRRTAASPPPPPARELGAFTEEWWSSWRRANALGWDYLDAMSGLMRLNMNAFTRASLFVPPFVPTPFAPQH
jgi:hypothetical protein